MFNDLNEISKCLDEAERALKESPNEFDAQAIIADLNVINCPTQPSEMKKSLGDDILSSMGGSFTGDIISMFGNARHEKKKMQALHTEQLEMLSEVDKLLIIFDRLAAHGFYDFRFLNFSDRLLGIAEEIHDRKLPYDKRKIMTSILNVPDAKIYLQSPENKKDVEQVRLQAQGEMRR